eukprot:gene11000-3705_t
MSVYDEAKSRNPNTVAISGIGFWMWYIVTIFFFIFLFVLIGTPKEVIFSIINLLHAFITFFFLHWLKGSPFPDDFHAPGKYDKMTFWEQIDENVMFSPIKKRFLIIPLFLTGLAIYMNGSVYSIYLNLFICVFSIAGKLPAFHGVRLFGINKD